MKFTISVLARNEYQLSLLKLDLDKQATRFIIQDRVNISLLYHGIVPESGQITLVTPLKYSIDPNLMVTIFDDTGLFNGEMLDFVKSELLNATLATKALHGA